MFLGINLGLPSMIRISLPFIYELSTQFEPLERLPDQKTRFGEVFLPLAVAQHMLQTLSGSLYAPYLRTSSALLQQLLGHVNSQLGTSADMDREVSPFELLTIKNAFGQYRTALLAELGTFNTYFVTQKGGFDMHSLLAAGETLFPSELSSKVPEALIDAREAAKWPAPGFTDTELGVLMEPEVCYGATEVYEGVQA
jgi:hypothetical protein